MILGVDRCFIETDAGLAGVLIVIGTRIPELSSPASQIIQNIFLVCVIYSKEVSGCARVFDNGDLSMTFAEGNQADRTTKVPADFNGQTIWIEVAQPGREDVAYGVKSFQTVADSIQAIASAITASLDQVKPTKASVKYGLEIGIEQGSLVAAIVRGSGKANLEISLEWERKETD